MSRQLTDAEFLQLDEWLKDLNVNTNKLNRQFSDGVQVAKILKRFYPKLIDLHNYQSRSRITLKKENWYLLNFKALSKLGIEQNEKSIQNLATCKAGAIEYLLFQIMELQNQQIRAIEAQIEEQQHKLWRDNDDIMYVTVQKKVGDKFEKVEQKLILYSIYENVLRELQSKEMYLNLAKQKVAHLENMLQVRGERITQLAAQIAKYTAGSGAKKEF